MDDMISLGDIPFVTLFHVINCLCSDSPIYSSDDDICSDNDSSNLEVWGCQIQNTTAAATARQTYPR